MTMVIFTNSQSNILLYIHCCCETHLLKGIAQLRSKVAIYWTGNSWSRRPASGHPMMAASDWRHGSLCKSGDVSFSLSFSACLSVCACNACLSFLWWWWITCLQCVHPSALRQADSARSSRSGWRHPTLMNYALCFGPTGRSVLPWCVSK